MIQKTTIEIQRELSDLRKRWASEPEHRRGIELQARALKIILEIREGKRPLKKHPSPDFSGSPS